MPNGKQIERIDYTAIVNDSAPTKPDDPGYAGMIANEAIRLDPLRELQTAFDQSLRHAESVVRGDIWHYGGSFREHAESTMQFAQRRYDILHTAATAANRMRAAMQEQFNIATGETMTQDNLNEGPQLTATGEPHPLQEGDYDPAKDQTKAPNESEVAALAAGHTTPAMAEAMAKADTANPDESPSSSEPPTSAPPTPAPPDAAPGANLSQTPPTPAPPKPADPAPTPPDDKGKAKSRR
jgi:hypothetical protein